LNLRDQLPYLGVEQGNGTIEICEHITLDKDDYGNRPDYKSFRSEILQSEFNCAGVLIGIRGIENFKQIVDEAARELGLFYPEVLNNPAGQLYYEISVILDEIRKMFDLGVDLGEKDGGIKAIKRQENPLFKHMFFKTDTYYKPVQFLKWAKSFNLPIPDELQFNEQKDGKIVWSEDVQGNTNENTVGGNFEYWAKDSIDFCQDELKKNGQLPRKEDVLTHIENQLKKKDEKLGKYALLPDAVFQKIWNKIPSKYKRKLGEKTKK